MLAAGPLSAVDTTGVALLILALMIRRSHLGLLGVRPPRRLLLLGALLTILLHAGAALAQNEQPLQVVVSLNPYQDLVDRVAGERVSVTTILPPGASPHAFDPTPSQAARLARADLVIMNGGLDLWLNRLVAATAPGTPVLVVMEHVEFAPLEGHEHADEHATDHEHDHEHDHAGDHDHEGGVNAHIWLDPLLMTQAVDAIAAALTELDPAGGPTYASNAERVRGELLALHAELVTVLAPAAGQPFVPFHDAWVYFAERYDLNIVVTLEPFPGREPSPRYVAEAVLAVQASGAPVIFAERQLGSRSADVVAQSAGVGVALLDPIGGAPGPATYDELLLQNATIIVAALTTDANER